MTASVRIAGPEDREEILRLLRQGHHENGMFPYDFDRVGWWLTRLLEPEHIDQGDTGPRGAVGVIGDPTHLEGLAVLTIGCFWYSAKRHLEEFIVYVDPKYRFRKHHKTLIGWMKEQSVITGLPLVTGIFSLQPRTEAKVRLYEGMLPKAGAFFCFDPITHGSSAVMTHH